MRCDQLITIIDDFYETPDRIREIGLNQPYQAPATQTEGMASGPIAHIAACPDAIRQQVIENLHPLCQTGIQTLSITFRYTTQATIKRRVCHTDGRAQMAGVIYLTRPDHCQGGTFFFRHRPTGDLMRRPEHLSVYDYHHAAEWELIHQVEMAFNRLVFYPGHLFHAVGTPFFGDSIHNGRLTQSLFVHADHVPNRGPIPDTD